jgi:hypothetical protein
MRTFIAPNIEAANKFVRIYENIVIDYGSGIANKSIVTGYKMLVDMENITYS